jgi:hypothetical protein
MKVRSEKTKAAWTLKIEQHCKGKKRPLKILREFALGSKRGGGRRDSEEAERTLKGAG